MGCRDLPSESDLHQGHLEPFDSVPQQIVPQSHSTTAVMSGQVLCCAPCASRATRGQAISACSASINIGVGHTADTSLNSFFDLANITLMPVLEVRNLGGRSRQVETAAASG